MLKRWNRHVYNALHPNKSKHNGRSHFASAIRKYGKDAFAHEVLEVCNLLEAAQLAEECWIELFETRDPAKGFNLMRGGLHVPHPITNPWERPGFRERVSAAMKGKRPSPETVAKVAAANRGKKHSPEHIEKVAAAHRGKPLSEELKHKLSQVMTGKTHTEETKRKIGEANLGRVHTAETRAKIAAKSLGRKHTPDAIERMSEIKVKYYAEHSHPSKGKRHSPESIAKMSAALTGRSPSAETRAKWSSLYKGMKIDPEAIVKRTVTRAAKRLVLSVMEA
jgi:hypothetical protein